MHKLMKEDAHWHQMAKLLWEEQVKEQLQELQHFLTTTPERTWSHQIERLTQQLAQGQDKSSEVPAMPHIADKHWTDAALKLWEAQVKEQLFELDALDSQLDSPAR